MRKADCPGVLDYAICSLSLLQYLHSLVKRVHCCLVSVKETLHVVVHFSGFQAKYCLAFSYHVDFFAFGPSPLDAFGLAGIVCGVRGALAK